jgi:hypothetical protein
MTYKLYLQCITTTGCKSINAIKAVRTITDLGLKDAKDFVDGVRECGGVERMVKECVSFAEVELFRQALEGSGFAVRYEKYEEPEEEIVLKKKTLTLELGKMEVVILTQVIFGYNGKWCLDSLKEAILTQLINNEASYPTAD